MLNLPEVALIEPNLKTAQAVEVESTVRREVKKLLEVGNLRSGQSVAVAVGSRGITGLAVVVATIIRELKERHLEPFIVPAMGSHGGATAEGQQSVLNSLGIFSEKLQVDFRAEMETEKLGTTSDGVSVFFSKSAFAADHVLVCNRIKPHTIFTGTIQSGLQKMLTIGLGKAKGAAAYHQAARDYPFEKIVRESVSIIGNQVSLLGGMALLENSQKELCKIEGVPFSGLAQREAELLLEAESLMPRLPVKKIDLLIIDEIGKEISGSGLDANVVGRKYNDHVSDQRDWCQTRFIHVRGLTQLTAGNATGIGIAEFCTESVRKQVHWPKTIINALTAQHPTAAMCPITLPTDRDVLKAVSGMIGVQGRFVHIKNTLDLKHLIVSQSCLNEVREYDPRARISSLFPMKMRSDGSLMDLADQLAIE